ncbi:MAG: hypothetical protein ACRCW9_09790 [Cetobacterium sp.]
MLMYFIKYFDLKENKIKRIWFEDQKEAIDKYNSLSSECETEFSFIETDANKKLIKSYFEKVLKRLNIIVYKKYKSWFELETDEYEYEIFKVNEFWNLNKCHKTNCDDYGLYQDTNLKKLIKRHYE